MAETYTRTARFRGASFRLSDLHGVTIRDSDVRGMRISSSFVDDLRITGFDGRAGTVLVDDVDVSAFVEAELDRRHPERVRLHALRTVEDHREMWALLETLWDETVARAERLPEAARQERVDGEWSVTETLRHLVFAVDTWVGRVIRDEASPHHPYGLTPTDMGPDAAAALGLDVDARPSFAEAVELHAARRAQVREVLAALSEDDLRQVRTTVLAPGEEPEESTVDHAVRVLLREHCEHRRFAVRDLAVLEGR